MEALSDDGNPRNAEREDRAVVRQGPGVPQPLRPVHGRQLDCRVAWAAQVPAIARPAGEHASDRRVGQFPRFDPRRRAQDCRSDADASAVHRSNLPRQNADDRILGRCIVYLRGNIDGAVPMRLAPILCVFAAVAAIHSHALAAAPLKATVTIDSSAPGNRIASEIYGQFSEQLGDGITKGIWVGEDSPIPNIHGFRRDVVAALKELHVPVLRWPGGCYADTYHWRDGIGPSRQRPITLNKWWGNNEEGNAVGTHEYFELAELIGAKTFLSINVATGTAGEAKDWVEYVTSPTHSALAQLRRANGREQPWTIDYVGIGNESWGCGRNLTAAQYAPQMRIFGTFVRQAQGPKIVSVGPSADD